MAMPRDHATDAPPAWELDDPVAAAVGEAHHAGCATADVLAAAERLARGADPAVALPALLDLVRQYPGQERIQLLAVRTLERLRDRAGAMPAWRSLLARFPRCPDALLLNLRWLLRQEGPAAATQALARCFPEPPDAAADIILLARGWEELGHPELADAAFDRLERLHPQHEAGWLARLRIEEARGRPWRALAVAETGLGTMPAAPRLQAAALRLGAGMVALDALVPPAARDGDLGGKVLARLVERAAQSRQVPPPVGDALGPVVLVGATLGAGGAERQMALTAAGLQQSHRFGRHIAGLRLGGARVICRGFEGRPAAAFFAPGLEVAGVDLQCYAAFPESPAALDPATRDLMAFLPPRVAEATLRLTAVLRAMAPPVVHLWQDGTILACALAALLAGVPRLVLGVRTAPPQDRPERLCAEYAWLYPLLARLPGVTWVSNSRFGAERHAACIGMDPARFHIVPNGVAALPSAGPAAAQAMASRFDAQCPPGFTVGAVLRMDANKRPLDFLECAARLLRQRPDARFILVGDGPLRPQVEARAAALGGRVLLTGRSADVGFWLARMDAMLMLSRHEGLPNAVLEAQAARVPVVATPAGGTAEALRDGITGFLLGSAAAPDLDEAVARLLHIAAAGGRRGLMARMGQNFVARNFSVEQMLEGTVRSYVA